VVFVALSFLVAATSVMAPAAPAAVAGYTVTSTGDEGDAAARASCTSGTGPCTLRAAILEANTHPNDPSGPDHIQFGFEGPGPHIIAVTSSLPAITDPVVVDAGLPPAETPRQVELTGADCLLTTSVACGGLVIAADSTTVRGLAINGFFSSIRAQAPSGQVLTDLVIEGNYLGTNAAGDSLEPHPVLDLDVGLQLFGVAGSRVGGDPALGEGNVIAGFHSHQIDGEFVSTTRFLGNRIGTNPAGTASLGGGGNGIHLVQGGENVFGEPGAGNVISGLSGPSRGGGLHSGILLLNTHDDVIQGNRIGVNTAGDDVVPNTGLGVELQAVRTVIGGSPAAANVISGNGAGISMATSTDAIGTDTPAANEVSFNRIGTDVSGEKDLGNFSVGIAVHGAESRIHHNVIAGNGTADQRANGITLQLGSPNSLVENNWIGVSALGRPLGNTGFGVLVSDDPFVGGGSIIGGSSAAGNHIAFNGQTGVEVSGSRFEAGGNHPGNTIRGNSIHDNGDPGDPSPYVGLGIDLHTAGHNSGPDAIDPLDGDTGANEQQNAPEINDVEVADGRTLVTGQLHSTPGQSFILDLYANSVCDATGYGEGERWLTSATITTAELHEAEPGTATFAVTLDEVLHSPQTVAATATNANGSTSEFSACETGSAPPLEVSKTAAAAFDRDWTWTITKEADASYALFAGESVSHPYKVTVRPEPHDKNWTVAGTITVSNPNAVGFTGVTVTDAVDNGGTCAVTGGAGITVAANSSASLDYACNYPTGPTASSGTNTATATWDRAVNDTAGSSAQGSATFAFGNPANETNAVVTVVDDNVAGTLFSANRAASSAEYSRTFSCPTDASAYDANGVHELTHTNTATIVETGQTDTTTVTVTCSLAQIAKDANGTYDIQHLWDVSKSVTPQTQEKLAGETGSYQWTVTVDHDTLEGNFSVTGSLVLTNPSGSESMTATVVDQLDDDTPATITGCTGGTFTAPDQVVVPPDGTATCQYKATPSDRSATAYKVSATVEGVTVQSTAPITWTGAHIDPEVTLDDDQNNAFPVKISTGGTFPYDDGHTCSTDPGAYTDGSYTRRDPNTATLRNSGGVFDRASATAEVVCKLPPSQGATLLIIDEDSIDNGIRYATESDLITPSGPKFFTDSEVNEDKPGKSQRDVLRYFAANAGKTVTVMTGQSGDEGWFAPNCIPRKWLSGSRNSCLTGAERQTAIDNYFGANGSAAIPAQSRLDKTPAVMPLRALGLNALIGQDVCAVVYDSDVSINYDSNRVPYTSGNLQGETLGVVAFKVLKTTTLDGFSSSTLPQVTFEILDTAVCGNWVLLNAPVPASSSVPKDRVAPGSPTGYRALRTMSDQDLFY
jgi:CSLREA domain-containing protein